MLTSLSWGRLAIRIHPARLVNLVVNDYVLKYPMVDKCKRYGPPWGPSVPVNATKSEDIHSALETLRRIGLFEKLPKLVKEHLQRSDLDTLYLTDDDLRNKGIRVHSFVLSDPQDSAEAAAQVAEKMGLTPLVVTTSIEGEASEVGTFLAAIATEIVRTGRPVSPPCLVICSGEMTVTLSSSHGLGGRNQECVLSSALRIENGHNIVIASIGTDGTDGPTDIAGGIVDGYTLQRASEIGMDLREMLVTHNSSYALRALQDAIYFNEPGNNVCDLSMIIVS